MSQGLFDQARGELDFLYISYHADMSLGELVFSVLFFHTLFDLVVFVPQTHTAGLVCQLRAMYHAHPPFEL